MDPIRLVAIVLSATFIFFLLALVISAASGAVQGLIIGAKENWRLGRGTSLERLGKILREFRDHGCQLDVNITNAPEPVVKVILVFVLEEDMDMKPFIDDVFHNDDVARKGIEDDSQDT